MKGGTRVMPFGEHSTDRSFGTARRSRSPARDASIDEILKSIQQIIDEEPLTMRSDQPAKSDRAARAPASERPAQLRSLDDAPSQPAPRKRPARVLRPAAEDDVLAELLAPPSEAPLAEASPVTASAIEPVADAELASAPLAAEPVSAEAAPDVAAVAESEVQPEPTDGLVESAPVAAETTPELPLAVGHAPAEVAAEPPLAQEFAPSSIVEAKQEEPASINAADALLQSLAAGLGATGFEVSAPSPVDAEVPKSELAAPTALALSAPDAKPQPEASPSSPAPALTPAQAAAAAVAEVAAASVASPMPIAEPAILAPASGDGQSRDEIVAAAVAPIEEGAAPIVLPPAPVEGLEDGIATMLRPLLREWLDAHLPRMVEKALKEELRERPLAASSSTSA